MMILSINVGLISSLVGAPLLQSIIALGRFNGEYGPGGIKF